MTLVKETHPIETVLLVSVKMGTMTKKHPLELSIVPNALKDMQLVLLILMALYVKDSSEKTPLNNANVSLNIMKITQLI